MWNILLYLCATDLLQYSPPMGSASLLINKYPRPWFGYATAGLPLLCLFILCICCLLLFSIIINCVLGVGLYPPPCCFYMYVCLSLQLSIMCFSQTCRCVPMRTTINPQPQFHLGVADIYALGMPHHSRLSSYPFLTKSTV